MKKMNLTETEIKNILDLHIQEKTKKSFFVEQAGSLRSQLDYFIKSGCISGGTIGTVDSKNPNKQLAIIKPSTKDPNKDIYFFIDFTYGSYDDTGKFVFGGGKWKCDEIGKIEQKTNTTSLNDNQRKVLELLRPLNWFNTPKPTDVEVDSGLYRKINLSDDKPEEDEKYPEEFKLINTYNKYFLKDYPKGTNNFYVYKKTVTQPNAPGKVERVEATAESCKTSIESLYNHMRSPNTYPIENSTKRSYVSTAQRCAEPANKQLFLLRFGLDKKLESIARKYGIKLS
jgi:hypothetical protein